MPKMNPQPRRAHTAAALLAAAALAACAAAAAPGATAEVGSEPMEIPFETLAQRSVPGGSGAERRQAIRRADVWSEVWTELAAGHLDATPPAVDFADRMVLLAAMPTLPCNGRVTIRRISLVDGELVVDLLEEPPDPSLRCLVAHRPFHAVALERRDEPLVFRVETRITPAG